MPLFRTHLPYSKFSIHLLVIIGQKRITMNFYRYLTTVFVIVLTGAATGVHAQSTINGIVIDGKRSPLPFASILLKKTADSGIYKTATSNNEGRFVISDVPAGSYLIEINLVGYEKYVGQVLKIGGAGPTVNLDTIIIESFTKMLREVSIKAQTPMIERQI